ncbi:MAG: hypothetical protein C4576_03220 [Desulfobacteraceae bacterium]|nr:MAG: hypothetical protein C4576_03220 [Desulfobacteraceae bacterium]
MGIMIGRDTMATATTADMVIEGVTATAGRSTHPATSVEVPIDVTPRSLEMDLGCTGQDLRLPLT